MSSAIAMGFFLLASFLLPSLANTTETATDHQALMSFRSLIRGDPFQALGSWGNQSIPMCRWGGVTCGTRGRRRGRVVALLLPRLNLLGTISPSIGNLTCLRQLDLRENRFHGVIPSQLQRLVQLERLNLSRNSIGGEIPPSLESCVHLQVVSLSHNNLHGVIPTSIGAMSDLRVIDLKHNMLTGSVPRELASLHNLEVLALQYNNLTGDIPVEIGNLKALFYLHLLSNMIVGEIPPEIANLTNLIDIDLSFNRLTGSIPTSLGGLQKLQYLSLSYNQLSGAIPYSLGNLSSLQLLDVQVNGLTGKIPESLGNLKLLNVLSLTSNNLTSSIPHTLGKLNSLVEFYLNGNQLEGSIPTSVYNLSSLHFFSVDYNNLSGSITYDFKLTKLQVLNMNNNQFHGAIPDALCNASMLQLVQLGDNFLSGVIPKCLGANMKSLSALLLQHGQLEATNDADWDFISSLTNCSMLRYLDLNYNRLEGMMPNSMANLSANLIYLGVGSNMLRGDIPKGIGNLVNLQYLHLQDNFIHGTIPESIGNLRKLGELYLSNNSLSGSVPSTLGNFTMLNRLVLDRNMLTGQIPSSLRSCPLEMLSLPFNRLVGPIPKEIFLISTLSVALWLQGNMLTGAFPPEVSNLVNLEYLDVSDNRISGPIPSSLAQCASLQHLGMGGNLLEGTIPASMSELKGLLVLDLSRNNLSGNIPTFLESMKGLTSLNISFNNFQGEVPKRGIFLNASGVEIEGNYGLCGGIPQFHLPPCLNHHTTKKWSRQLVLAISIGGTILCAILVLVLLTQQNWRNKLRKVGRVPPLPPNGQHMIRVSYVDLVKATSGFASENLIGIGSFGSVYRGTMMNEDQEVIVAIKVLNLHQQGASQSFAAECETLRSIRHRNLVKILTACSSIDFRGLDFKALVFEFMPNGNLDQWLHHNHLEDGIHGVLSLTQRIDIAIDVASALEYLHQNKPAPIVHCDLKPSNILLDKDKIAHVGDFGLARFLHQDDTSLPEISSGWAKRRGTTGYAAPEYGQGNKVSVYGDIYSYGILLLEMFSGKRPTDGEFLQDLNIHMYIEEALMRDDDQATNMVELSLLSAEEELETQLVSASNCTIEMRISCITSVLRIGILCSKEVPTARMQIGDAMRELLGIRDKYRAQLASYHVKVNPSS